jgi:hypothetical protein
MASYRKWKARIRSAAHQARQLGANLRDVARQAGREFLGSTIYVVPVCWVRFLWFGKVLRRTRCYSTGARSASIADHTIAHNLKGLQLGSLRAFSGQRPNLLLRILSAIEVVRPREQSILLVGPRAESELFLAVSYGFHPRRVRGLDLISYTPWVDLGDMHHMPYADNSWNVVVLGWVLAYSESPELACREVLRVVADGGVVAIGAQYHPLSPQEIEQQLGYRPGASTRVDSTAQMLELFGSSVDQVYFRHDVAERRRDQPGSVLLAFSVNKRRRPTTAHEGLEVTTPKRT